MKLSTIFVAALLATLPATGSSAQATDPSDQTGPCPADHPLLRQFVERILTADAKAPDREELGLAAVAGQPLNVLGDHQEDYPVCAQLYRKVPREYRVRGKGAPDTVVFYRIGDRYLLALSSLPARPGEARPGPDQFVAYDLALNEIGGMVY